MGVLLQMLIESALDALSRRGILDVAMFIPRFIRLLPLLRPDLAFPGQHGRKQHHQHGRGPYPIAGPGTEMFVVEHDPTGREQEHHHNPQERARAPVRPGQ